MHLRENFFFLSLGVKLCHKRVSNQTEDLEEILERYNNPNSSESWFQDKKIYARQLRAVYNNVKSIKMI